MVALADVGGLGVDAERDRAAGAGDEAVVEAGEIAGDQREQIGRLGERVFPLGEVAAARQVAGSRAGLPLDSSTGNAALSASIRTLKRTITSGRSWNQVDAAEALGLALGAEHPARE